MNPMEILLTLPVWVLGMGLGGVILALLGFGLGAMLAGNESAAAVRRILQIVGVIGLFMVGMVSGRIFLVGDFDGGDTGDPAVTETPEVEEETSHDTTSVCGDGYCYTAAENSDLCPEDCPCVDDGACRPGEGISCLDCGESGGCGAPCESSETCPEGLSCFNGVCWQACACGGDCGGGEGSGGEGGGPTACDPSGCGWLCDEDSECSEGLTCSCHEPINSCGQCEGPCCP